MKRTTISLLFLTLAAVLAPWVSPASTPNPPGQISYQGFLTDANGIPLATNTPQNYTVTFRIWNQSTGGSVVWAESQMVTVDRGYFTVMLGSGMQDSGGEYWTNNLTGVFSGGDASDRYIGITASGSGITNATEIVPRMKMLSSPYSLHAAYADNAGIAATAGYATNAANAVNAVNVIGTNLITVNNLATNIGVWSVSGTNVFRAGGNVGIGTASPVSQLQINGSAWGGEALRLSGADYNLRSSDTNGISLLLGVNGANNRQFWIADSASLATPNSVNPVIRIMPNGSTIDCISTDGGTPKPLHLGSPGSSTLLMGTVAVGPSGQYQVVAAAAEEAAPLRIVRGNVLWNGTTLSVSKGAGFTVQRNWAGDFTISFNTPFSDIPTFTANSVDASADVVSIEDSGPGYVHLHIGVRNVGWYDMSFNFIAIGPR